MSSFRVLHDYPRRAHLDFFHRNPNPFYSATFELDATRVRARAKELGASTYAALCWSYHRALIALPAFRTRLIGEDVVLFDTVRLGMTVPAPARTFTFATMDWDDNAARFLSRAAEVMADASTRVDLSGGAEPNFAYYTSLPKVPFTSFATSSSRIPPPGNPRRRSASSARSRAGRSFRLACS